MPESLVNFLDTSGRPSCGAPAHLVRPAGPNKRYKLFAAVTSTLEEFFQV